MSSETPHKSLFAVRRLRFQNRILRMEGEKTTENLAVKPENNSMMDILLPVK